MSIKIENIIVQAGGKGTRMGQLTYNKPKALIPVDNLPMLFHLFRNFPRHRFIIIGDYKYSVLEKYLKVFAEVEYQMVDARGKKGTCAGIGEALELIPDQEPFMLIWSDLILPKDFTMPDGKKNYLGISKDFICRWQYKNGRFKEKESDEFGVAGLFTFMNKNELCNLPKEGEFVRWLCEKKMFFEELPLYRTKEYGVLQEYNKLKVSRCRPFNRITLDGNRIIKEGINEQGRSLAMRECAWYKMVMDRGFNNIPLIYDTDPLIMERINGKNVYECQVDDEEKKKVLKKLVKCIDRIHSIGSCEANMDSFREAYIGKTFDRLNKIRNLVPFANDEYIKINGKKCRNVFYIKETLERMVISFFPTEFKFLHGDCTFSNIMLRENGEPVLIDPRGYFGTTEIYGDPAYDWVKLYYSIVGNYDQFNLKHFILKIEENEVFLDIESNHWEKMENDFLELVKSDVSREQLMLLLSIVYLSLTTYAWEDYDSICGAYYKGLLILNDVIS